MHKEYIPKGERVWVNYFSEKNELMFIITTKESTRDYYYLYELVDGKPKRLGKSRSPGDLEEKYSIRKRIIQ